MLMLLTSLPIVLLVLAVTCLTAATIISRPIVLRLEAGGLACMALALLLYALKFLGRL